MQTILYGRQQQVTIDGEGPIAIIGEKINPSGNPRLIGALKAGDLDYVCQLASLQIEAGAQVLDVNVAHPEVEEIRILPQAIQLLQRAFDVPLVLDSPDASVLEAALKAVQGKCLVNSVNGNEGSLRRILPLVADHHAAVIGLTLDEGGIPSSADQRLGVAERILEAAAAAGIPSCDVLIDPLILSVGTDDRSGLAALEAIRRIRQALDVNVVLGASNISYGLPHRLTINTAFAAMAAYAGVCAVITDPTKLAGVIRAADLLLGRDPFAARYLEQYRRGRHSGG